MSKLGPNWKNAAPMWAHHELGTESTKPPAGCTRTCAAPPSLIFTTAMLLPDGSYLISKPNAKPPFCTVTLRLGLSGVGSASSCSWNSIGTGGVAGGAARRKEGGSLGIGAQGSDLDGRLPKTDTAERERPMKKGRPRPKTPTTLARAYWALLFSSDVHTLKDWANPAMGTRRAPPDTCPARREHGRRAPLGGTHTHNPQAMWSP